MLERYTLRQARVRMNYTQENASSLIGVSRNTIINWENGKSAPTVAFLKKILEVYELETVDQLIFEAKV